MSVMRRRRTFPTLEASPCPHCGATPEVLAEGMLWVCGTCGAMGYYDDGYDIYPDALYGIRGAAGALFRHGSEMRA